MPPIANFKPTASVQPKPAIPRVEEPKAQSVLVDTKYVPRSSLLTYIEGSIYTVDYYSQILTGDSAVFGQDPTESKLYQQYKKILGLEIKVSNPLETSQDSVTKTMTITGGGHIRSQVVPNEGDMFCADVGDGRLGVFRIRTSEKKSIFREAVFYVDYVLLYFVDAEPLLKEDLDNKVIQILHYVKDLVQEGNTPLVSTDELSALTQLSKYFKTLVDSYFQWFYSKEYGTLIVPGQQRVTYDPYVAKVLHRLLETRDHPLLVRTKVLNVNDSKELNQPQIWQAIFERDVSMLTYCNQKYQLVNIGQFQIDPMMEGIRYSGVNQIVYPVSLNASIDAPHSSMGRFGNGMSLEDVSSLVGDYNDLESSLENSAVTPIKKVTSYDTYVFSPAFYKQEQGQSKLENLVSSFVTNKGYAASEVLAIAKDSIRWGQLEKYYYTPMLLLLIKGLIRNPK